MKKIDEKGIKETEQFIKLVQQLDPIRQKGILLVLKGANLIAKGNEEALYE